MRRPRNAPRKPTRLPARPPARPPARDGISRFAVEGYVARGWTMSARRASLAT